MKCRVTAKYAGNIKSLDARKDLTLMDLSQDSKEIKNHFGNRPAVRQFDSFLVKVEDGDYTEVYGFHGIVANLNKPVYKITRKYCR
jgi:hypothetical protein